MKQYVHGLFTKEVENWTSDCTQLYFVESIRKNFVLTDGTGSYCNGGLHSLFYKPQWFKICFLGFIMIKKRCDVAAFAKLSHVTLHARTVTDGNLSVVEKGRFFCRSHILALIFVDLWSQVVWGRLWHRYHRIIWANVGKNSPKLWHLSSSFAACLQPTAADFVPYLDQRSLFGTISFIKEFNFDIK